jgi:hypothetical protein
MVLTTVEAVERASAALAAKAVVVFVCVPQNPGDSPAHEAVFQPKNVLLRVIAIT